MVIYKRSAGGVVVSKKTGKIILVDQRTSWSFPKGHIERKENILSAAKREIYKETGIKVKDLEFINYLGSYQSPKIQNEIKTIYLFLFKTEKNKLKPVDYLHPRTIWLEKG